jgi:hypothetical protein
LEVSKLLLTCNNSCGLRDLVTRGLVEINAVEVGLDEHVSESQGFGSGSVLDPDSIGSVDPDSESGSGSRRAKTTKVEKNSKNSCFEVLDVLF